MALWVTLPVFLCSDGVLFCAFGSAVLPSLMDRLGGRQRPGPRPGPDLTHQDHGPGGHPTGEGVHTLTLTHTLLGPAVLMCVCFQYVWDWMLGGFMHKNNRTREGVCLCLIATLNA